jgi:hypothetical protein
LEGCQHEFASGLDHETLMNNKSPPISFMRGCGLPDSLMRVLPGLRTEPGISCFISYATNDRQFVKKLQMDLQNRGVRCWFAEHDIRAGRKLYDQISEAIKVHDRLLLILSKNSMASHWVRTEITEARKIERELDERVLLPISLVPYKQIQEWSAFDSDTGTDLASEIRELYIPNFSRWKQRALYMKSFNRLLSDLGVERWPKPVAAPSRTAKGPEDSQRATIHLMEALRKSLNAIRWPRRIR